MMVWFHKLSSPIAHIIRALYCVELHDVDQEIWCAE